VGPLAADRIIYAKAAVRNNGVAAALGDGRPAPARKPNRAPAALVYPDEGHRVDLADAA